MPGRLVRGRGRLRLRLRGRLRLRLRGRLRLRVRLRLRLRLRLRGRIVPVAQVDRHLEELCPGGLGPRRSEQVIGAHLVRVGV